MPKNLTNITIKSVQIIFWIEVSLFLLTLCLVYRGRIKTDAGLKGGV